MCDRINIHNYLKLLYDFATYLDFQGTSISEHPETIKVMYTDRVLSDYPAPCDEQNLLLSFVDTTVNDFIHVYTRYRAPSPKRLCCCFP